MKLTIKSTAEHPVILGSFPDLFRVGEYQGNPTNYSAQLLLPKNSPQLAEFEKAARAFAKDAWGDQAKMAWEKQSASNSKLMRDGDGIDGTTSDGTPKPGWAGHVRIKASTKFPPKVIDKGLNELTEDSGKPYAGCHVSAQVELFQFRDKRELGLRLLAIQFVGDGEPFGGGGNGGADLSAFGPAEQAPAADKAEW